MIGQVLGHYRILRRLALEEWEKFIAREMNSLNAT